MIVESATMIYIIAFILFSLVVLIWKVTGYGNKRSDGYVLWFAIDRNNSDPASMLPFGINGRIVAPPPQAYAR